jgi:hypothetical protein
LLLSARSTTPGWANSLPRWSDFRIHYGLSAQMITTGIAIGSDGGVVLGSGATYGILVAILVFHGVICSAATRILARLNLAYVVINGEFPPTHIPIILTTTPYSISFSWNVHGSCNCFICLFKRSGTKGLGEGRVHFVREQHRMGRRCAFHHSSYTVSDHPKMAGHSS